MGASLDRLFVQPRLVLTARKIDLYDAINLVVYAKLPLIGTRRGKDLVAGFIRRDGVRVVPALMSARQKDELLHKYGRDIASLRYPADPSQYEPLLEKMTEANEPALPYFFHEHHQLIDRRHRAAMFADLHRELAGLVSTKEVALQITESERTYLMQGDAWMTAETCSAYLERHGVTPWWRNQENLESHARLERLLLSDGLAVSRSELSNGSDENQLPSFLFGKMLLSRTSAPRGYLPTREPERSDTSTEAPMRDGEFANSYYKPGKRKRNADSLRESAPANEEEFVGDKVPDRSAMTLTSETNDYSDPGNGARDSSIDHLAGERSQGRSEGPPVLTDDPDDTMLTKREVADLLGVSMNTVDNYRKEFEDFPEAVVYGANTLRWSKKKIERWKMARPAR